ncbi:MAG: right-handed parallel beta-helix repeat-containing protein, partial [Clostridia bacterium]|nr:right-handed parallel beta-helix repeat-containing protein [Clostridia bacterium]
TESKELYYYPASGVDMASASFEVPEKSELLTVEGLDGTLKAHDIEIDGLTFKMGAWNVPSELGFISWQSDAYWEKVLVYPEVTYNQMSGNIKLKYCDKITFKNNTVTAAGCTALTLPEGVSNTEIIGNAFTHSAAGAMTIGNYRQGTALHTDSTNQLCDNITVSNNTIYKMGESYYSCVGIGVYYGRNVTLSQNDILYIPNSGISVGWGWNPDVITTTENIKILNNTISFHGMKSRDSGGIYTLGKQKNCVIEENYIKDNGFSEKGIYHDQGTGGYTNSRNVLDMQQASYWTNDYHKNTLSMTYNDNYTSTKRYINRTNSIHNNTTYVLDRKWPVAAQNIIFGAGVSADYGVARAKGYGINSEKMALWISADSGIVTDNGGKITAVKDFSGSGLELSASGEVSWDSYASYENHALKFTDSAALTLKDFGKSDAFTVAFVAEFDKSETINGALSTLGIKVDGEADKTEGYSFGKIASYIYKTDGKSGVLYENGIKVAEWKKNAPYLSNDFTVGNNSALVFEAVCYKESISDTLTNALNEYFSDKYSINLPTSESLVLWLSADKNVKTDENGMVSAWGDIGDRRLGGLVQQNPGYMPKLVADGIGGKPAILFDGKDDSLWNYSTRWVGEEATVFVVMSLQSKETQSFGSVNGIKEFLTEIHADGSISTGDNLPDRIKTESGAFAFGKAQCLTYQRYPLFEEITPQDEVWLSAMPGVIKLYNGDSKIGEYSHNTKHADTEWGGFKLGTNDETTLSGKVAEVLIYDRLLTDSERASVTEYLKQKYNF